MDGKRIVKSMRNIEIEQKMSDKEEKKEIKSECCRQIEKSVDFNISYVQVNNEFSDKSIKSDKNINVLDLIKKISKNKEKNRRQLMEEERKKKRKQKKEKKIKKIYRSIFIHQIFEMFLNISFAYQPLLKFQQKYYFIYILIFFFNILFFGYFCLCFKKKIQKTILEIILILFFVTDVYMSSSLLILGNETINKVVISIFSSALFSSIFVFLLTLDKSKLDKKMLLLFISYPNFIFHFFYGLYFQNFLIFLSLFIILFFAIGSVFYINYLIKRFQTIGSSNIVLKVLISVYALPNIFYIVSLVIYIIDI